MTRYAIIGAGKVGRALARSLRSQGTLIVRSVSAITDIPARTTTFLCIPEAAIEAHAAALAARPLSYVTVSGSMTPKVFTTLGLFKVRTFHPLMGFTATMPRDFQGVPVGVDDGRGALAKLARAIGAHPFVIPPDRTLYHAAAVVAGAGVLTTWNMALRLIETAGVSKKEAKIVLLPIAIAALGNAATKSPQAALTGPVVRGDESDDR